MSAKSQIRSATGGIRIRTIKPLRLREMIRPARTRTSVDPQFLTEAANHARHHGSSSEQS